MPDRLMLADVTEARPDIGSGECLSVFFAVGEVPACCLIDPAVVSPRPAGGHWQLLGFDESRRRAYYTRVDHGAGFECLAAGARVGGSAKLRGDDR